MPFADCGDIRLFYTDEGAGDPPLLLVHGFGCDSHDWSWQLPHFADRRVVAVDLRGHGRSSAPAGGYSPHDLAADVARLLEHLALSPVVAMGHSLGGVVVSLLAVEHPDKVHALVCVDPGYLVPDEIEAMLAELVALAEVDHARAGEHLLALTEGPGSSAALRTWHRRRMAGMPRHVFVQTLRSLNIGPGAPAYFRNSAYLQHRGCPLLAFYGSPERAAAERGLLADPRSKVVSWEGAGHWLHQERPTEFNAIVDAWLRTLP